MNKNDDGSDLETVLLPGESLNEGIARVYAELVEETMMLNKVCVLSPKPCWRRGDDDAQQGLCLLAASRPLFSCAV
jgi:hypothetical protein